MTDQSSDVIEVGNKVQVRFSTHAPITGRITYIPVATGDSWHITIESGNVVYVQQFDCMLKLSEA